jgi:pimeloyl-ACP methyl ester carboxylesterase
MLALATPRRFTDPDYYKKIAPTVFGGKARNDPKAVEHAQDRFAIPPSARGYGQQMLAAAGWTSYRWLSSLTQRTLVLHGDDDPIVPLANGQLLARRIPGATLQVIPGGGHLFLLDQIDEVIPEIVSFLGEEEIPVEGTW